MDRLIQFALILIIATSSSSYVYKRHESDMPDTPPEFDLDDNYPTEYIEALIDKLNPAELQRLRSIINLHHRAGAPSSSRCLSYKHKISPHHAPDEFGIEYIIIHSEKLPKIEIDIEVCNYTKGYDCDTKEDDKRPTYANCCVSAKEMITFPVLPVPAKEFQARNSINYSDNQFIQKDLYIDSRCECETKPLDKLLENDTEICKLIDNYYD